MSVIYIMIAASLLIALVFLGAFLWSVRSGQMDDTTTPAFRVLFDDTVPEENTQDKSLHQQSTTD